MKQPYTQPKLESHPHYHTITAAGFSMPIGNPTNLLEPLKIDKKR
jgi:hypothetical protein